MKACNFNQCSIPENTKQLQDKINRMRNLHQTIALFIDLSKAFDTLNHDILAKKLDSYGICGKSKDWIIDHLSNKKMRCKIDSKSKMHKSGYYDLSVGTPQVSVLGPFLFLIFLYDLYLNVYNSNCILFADDTTLFKTHSDICKAILELQNDINQMTDWF